MYYCTVIAMPESESGMDSSEETCSSQYDSLSSPGSTSESSLGRDSEALGIAPYSYEPSSESEQDSQDPSSTDHEFDRLLDTSWYVYG